MLRFALAALLAAAPATAQELDFAPAPEAEARLIGAAFADLVREAEGAGAPVTLLSARADLDGDGADEVLGMVATPFACGAATGCRVGVFQGDALVAVVGADVVIVGPGVTNGWRDLTLGMATGAFEAVWTGDGYAVR